MLNMRDSFKRCAVLKLVLHLSKNGSTGSSFERREQKGVLGLDRTMKGFDTISHYSSVKKKAYLTYNFLLSILDFSNF